MAVMALSPGCTCHVCSGAAETRGLGPTTAGQAAPVCCPLSNEPPSPPSHPNSALIPQGPACPTCHATLQPPLSLRRFRVGPEPPAPVLGLFVFMTPTAPLLETRNGDQEPLLTGWDGHTDSGPGARGRGAGRTGPTATRRTQGAVAGRARSPSCQAEPPGQAQGQLGTAPAAAGRGEITGGGAGRGSPGSGLLPLGRTVLRSQMLPSCVHEGAKPSVLCHGFPESSASRFFSALGCQLGERPALAWSVPRAGGDVSRPLGSLHSPAMESTSQPGRSRKSGPRSDLRQS